MALPPHEVKTLKTFIHLTACDHYQHLPVPSQRGCWQCSGFRSILSLPHHLATTTVHSCVALHDSQLCCSLFLIRAQIASLRADL